jgi:uncharacterized membrane protein
VGTSRLEAFSDGVIAIIITIMVLELRVPHGGDLATLLPLWPVFLSYVLSFIYIGIYWNNHHHMLHVAERVTGDVLWANLHLLQNRILAHQSSKSLLAKAVGSDLKGKLSPLFYLCAIPLAYVHPAIAGGIYALVALIWLVPDRRIETRVK